MKNPTITTAINQMHVPNVGSLHMYYPDEHEARREAFRLGKPVFRSYINGQSMWSVKVKDCSK